MSSDLQQLQELVDQFNDADDLDDRDDILADILRHESAQVADFLRLLVAAEAEDPYTRADAWCGLYLRGDAAAKAQIFKYLNDSEQAYQFCVAAEATAEKKDREALAPLQAALERPLKAEALLAATTALERIDPKGTAAHFIGKLLAVSDPATLDFVRIDAMLKSLAASEDKTQSAELKKVGAHFLALAKKFPTDKDDLEELGEQALESAAQLLVEETPVVDDEE